MIFMCMFIHSYIINPSRLCHISLHVHSYILMLGTQHYDYLAKYVHSYIHAYGMYMYIMQHVIVQYIASYSQYLILL